MTIFRRTIMLFFAAVLFACGPQENNANNESSQIASEKEESTAIDVGQDEVEADEREDLLITAHMNSQLQIALGQVASERANSNQLREYSTTIVAENEQIQNNIKTLADAAGIEMAPALTPEYIALMDSIQSYTGEKFDSAFINTIVEEHEEDIDRFTTLSAQTDNPIVRDGLTDNLEIMQRHLSKLEEIQNEIKK